MRKPHKDIPRAKVVHTKYGDVEYIIVDGTKLEYKSFGRIPFARNQFYPLFYARKEFYNRVIAVQDKELLQEYAESTAKSFKEASLYTRMFKLFTKITILAILVYVYVSLFRDSFTELVVASIFMIVSLFTLIYSLFKMQAIHNREALRLREKLTVEQIKDQVRQIDIQLDIIKKAKYKVPGKDKLIKMLTSSKIYMETLIEKEKPLS